MVTINIRLLYRMLAPGQFSSENTGLVLERPWDVWPDQAEIFSGSQPPRWRELRSISGGSQLSLARVVYIEKNSVVS